MLIILTIRRAPGNFSPGGGGLKSYVSLKLFKKDCPDAKLCIKFFILGTWTCCQDAFAG
jgi:hypothetical protein